MVETSMEGGSLIMIQSKSSIIFTTIALSFVVAIEDIGVDGRFEETETTIMK
jgi:hypothetical protein